MQQNKYIVLGGGCFWCTQAIFKKLNGVSKVDCGYAGGETKNPTYEQVCTGDTMHAEVAKIFYDSSIISLEEILEIHFNTHDPTSVNRQGLDIGTQYRSIIFYNDENEKKIINACIENAQKKFSLKIVTEVQKLEVFYEAEGYHQDYYTNNKHKPYCNMVISTKIQKFENKYANKLKF